MAITKEFKEAVDTGKKIRVRIMLKDMMLVDPTLRLFDEMLSYAESKMLDIYDEHDDEELKYDSSDWDVSYMNSQMVAVVSNFSKERLNLLRNMVKHIYRDRAENIRKDEEYKSSATITRTQLGIGATAAGTVAAVTGICAHQTLLIVGGVAVAAVGVGLILSDKEA